MKRLFKPAGFSLEKFFTFSFVFSLILSVLFMGSVNQVLSQGQGNCEVGAIAKIEGSPFAYNGSIIVSRVIVKAGSDESTNGNACTIFAGNGNNGCYEVAGIGTTTVTVTKIGDGPNCKDISHAEFYAAASPTATATASASPTSTATATAPTIAQASLTPTPTATPSATPTSNPTNTPTATPTSSPNNVGGSVLAAATVADPAAPKGQVLGASTLAETGVGLDNVFAIAFIIGCLSTGIGVRQYAKAYTS